MVGTLHGWYFLAPSMCIIDVVYDGTNGIMVGCKASVNHREFLRDCNAHVMWLQMTSYHPASHLSKPCCNIDDITQSRNEGFG